MKPFEWYDPKDPWCIMVMMLSFPHMLFFFPRARTILASVLQILSG